MIEFFDTTTLVAAMVEDEPHHEFCAGALGDARAGYAASHSVAECFATLTGGRLGLHVSPAEAAALIRHNVHDRLTLVSLSPAEYLKVVESAGPAGARGGAVYDLLLLACARKVKAARIHTLNRRHFVALAPDLEPRLSTPGP